MNINFLFISTFRRNPMNTWISIQHLGDVCFWLKATKQVEIMKDMERKIWNSEGEIVCFIIELLGVFIGHIGTE